jgi:hypothetical protein
MKSFLETNFVRWRYLLVSALLGIVLCLQTTIFAADPPQLVVDRFYQWYIQNEDQYQSRIAEQEASFTRELYQQLVQAFQKNQRIDIRSLDFDPFCDCQVSTYGMMVRSSRESPENDQFTEVDIDVYAGLRPPGTTVPIRVLVTPQGNRWQMQNLVYRSGQYNLLDILRNINRS